MSDTQKTIEASLRADLEGTTRELEIARARNDELLEALEEILPLAETHLMQMPDRYGNDIAAVERARKLIGAA
jgi:hypothetical protein